VVYTNISAAQQEQMYESMFQIRASTGWGISIVAPDDVMINEGEHYSSQKGPTTYRRIQTTLGPVTSEIQTTFRTCQKITKRKTC
jgi:hypothetical protein